MNHHEWHMWDLGRAFQLREHWHLWLRHNGDVCHVTKIVSSEVTRVFCADTRPDRDITQHVAVEWRWLRLAVRSISHSVMFSGCALQS